MRDFCYFGCEAIDSVSHYVDCVPLPFIAGMFDDKSSPDDDAGAFYGVGPAASCEHVLGAILRNVIACAAYHAVRAKRRDVGVPTTAVAVSLARTAATHS